MQKEVILQAASEAYYLNPTMIRFLLIENLALKSLLHEKGLISPEEFKKHQEQAAKIMAMKEGQQLMTYFKSALHSTPVDASPSPSASRDQPPSEPQTPNHDSERDRS
jgi:hypothetical protein